MLGGGQRCRHLLKCKIILNGSTPFCHVSATMFIFLIKWTGTKNIVSKILLDHLKKLYLKILSASKGILGLNVQMKYVFRDQETIIFPFIVIKGSKPFINEHNISLGLSYKKSFVSETFI